MATFGSEEFIIDASKTTLVQKQKVKIERLFGVKIAFDVVSTVDEKKQQWLVVSGYQKRRSDAKTYVQSLCNPEKVTSVRHIGKAPLDDATLESIERTVAVVLQRTGSHTLQVMGSEMSCMLAISQLEQTHTVNIITQDAEASVAGPEKRASTCSSPTEMMQAVQVQDLMVTDGVRNYHTRTTACRDHAASAVHAAGSSGPGRSRQQQLVVEPSASKQSDGGESRGPVTDKHGATAEVPVSEVEKRKAQMQTLSLKLGYTRADIEESMLFFDFSQHNVPRHEFLAVLDEIRSNRQKEGSSEVTSQPKHGPQATKMSPGKKGPGLQQQKAGKGKQHPSSPSKHTVIDLTSQGSFESVPASVHDNNSSMDKSVIFMGEELDDSVLVVDPPSATASCSDQSKVSPHNRQSGNAISAKCGSKRKDFSDDEDQTVVLRPFSSDCGGNSAGTCANGNPEGQMTRRDAVDRSQEQPTSSRATETDLRFIVIDGSNVAMTHGNGKVYSCRGIQLCVEHFVNRGHRVKVWVPLTKTYKTQTGRHPPIVNQEILEQLKDKGYLGYTPARKLNNRHIVSYDDYFILDLAQREDGVVVSNDNFRDCLDDYSFIIGNRVLSYVFSDDHFMLPRDPLGRYGPTLEEFLRKSPAPHKPFPHNSRSQQMSAISHKLFNPSTANLQPRGSVPRQAAPEQLYSRVAAGNGPQHNSKNTAVVHPTAARRPPHKTQQLLEALQGVFPEKEQEGKLREVLQNHPEETDLNKLTNYCINAFYI